LLVLVDAKKHFIISPSRKSLGLNGGGGGGGKHTDSQTAPRNHSYHYTTNAIAATTKGDETNLGKSTLPCNGWKKQ